MEISTTRGANERRGERFNDGVDACTRFRLESHSTSCFVTVVVAGVFVGEGEILGVEPHREARVAIGVDLPIDIFSPHRSEVVRTLLQGDGISLRVTHMPGDESLVARARSESWVVGIEGTAVFVRCEDAEGRRSRECGSREVVVNEDTVAGVVPATIMPIGIFFADLRMGPNCMICGVGEDISWRCWYSANRIEVFFVDLAVDVELVHSGNGKLSHRVCALGAALGRGIPYSQCRPGGKLSLGCAMNHWGCDFKADSWLLKRTRRAQGYLQYLCSISLMGFYLARCFGSVLE